MPVCRFCRDRWDKRALHMSASRVSSNGDYSGPGKVWCWVTDSDDLHARNRTLALSGHHIGSHGYLPRWSFADMLPTGPKDIKRSFELTGITWSTCPD